MWIKESFRNCWWGCRKLVIGRISMCVFLKLIFEFLCNLVVIVFRICFMDFKLEDYGDICIIIFFRVLFIIV